MSDRVVVDALVAVTDAIVEDIDTVVLVANVLVPSIVIEVSGRVVVAAPVVMIVL